MVELTRIIYWMKMSWNDPYEARFGKQLTNKPVSWDRWELYSNRNTKKRISREFRRSFRYSKN